MKVKNIILIVSMVVVLALGFVGYKTWGSLDKIIEVGIESYGPEIIGADVQLASVNLNLTDGEAALNGLYIGNPEGYKTDFAMQVERVKVKLDIESITSDVVVIEEVMILGSSVIYELSSSGSNVDALAKNAQVYTGAEEQESENSDAGPKLLIKNLYINEGQVSVSHSILKGKTLSVALPNIHLKDIGKNENGATPGEVAEKVMESIKSGVGTAVASLSLGDTLSGGVGAVKDGAGHLMDKAKGAGEKLKGIFE